MPLRLVIDPDLEGDYDQLPDAADQAEGFVYLASDIGQYLVGDGTNWLGIEQYNAAELMMATGILSQAGGSGDVTASGTLTSGILTVGGGSKIVAAGSAGVLPTSLTTPILIGGTAVGSIAEIRATSGVGAGSEAIKFTIGSNGATEAARITSVSLGSSIIGKLGIGTTAPNGILQVTQGFTTTIGTGNGIVCRLTDSVVSASHGALVNFNGLLYYTGQDTSSPLNSTGAIYYGLLTYGSDGVTPVTTTTGTSTVGSAHVLVQGNGDQTNERNVLYAGDRVEIGTGFTQSTGPAGSEFSVIDANLQGPINVQPGLLGVITAFVNNYYNGSPSRAESFGLSVVTGFGRGGENPTGGPHKTATTHPVDVGISVAGTSGSALPGATAGFTIGMRLGGAGGSWGQSGAITTSLFQDALEVRDYTRYGVNIHTAGSGGNALVIQSDAGNIAIGTTTFNAARKVNLVFSLGTTQSAGIYTDVDNAATAVGSTHGVWGNATGTNTSGTQSLLAGLRGDGVMNATGGTASITTGGRFRAQNTLGTSTVLASIYCAANSTPGGTSGTNTGIYIEAQTGGTGNYQIFSAGSAQSSLTGGLTVGFTSAISSVALLEVRSTVAGVRFPNMTTAQKAAITGVEGLVVYDTTLHKLCVWGQTTWETITSA
jgi:hypothetical protein